MSATHHRYLGDAVYAFQNGYGITLLLGNHDPREAEHIIVLEPEVIASLEKYLVDLRESIKRGETTRYHL